MMSVKSGCKCDKAEGNEKGYPIVRFTPGKDGSDSQVDQQHHDCEDRIVDGIELDGEPDRMERLLHIWSGELVWAERLGT